MASRLWIFNGPAYSRRVTADIQLSAAIVGGDAAGVAAALAHGADPDVLVGRHGWGGLVESARTGRADIVRSLLDAGATVAGVGRYRATPLRVAAGNGHADVVQLLVGAGALATEPSDRGSVLAHVVSESAYRPSRALLETLAVLLRLGATPGGNEDLPIIAAIQASAPPAVLRVLLDHGANPDQRRSDGTPILVLAARHGDHAAVDLLVQAGADVNATDARGRTALMYAVERNKRTVAGVLLLGGADRDLVSPDGMTALQLAQGWQWQNIQFALGETSVGMDNVPIARTLLRLTPGGFLLQADPKLFRLLAAAIDVVVADLGEDEWEVRTSCSAEAALTFAARLRSDPAPTPNASWYVMAASRDELTVVRSALVEMAWGTTRVLPDGVNRPDVQDLAEDIFRQLDR
jgi:ankyrin repeat protein